MLIQQPQKKYDIVIVGGGMVGASFACAIANAVNSKKLSILVVEAISPESNLSDQLSFDARSTALSFGSSRIFDRIGLWEQLKDVVAAISEIHVSDKGRFGAVHLSHDEYNVDALGYVIENKSLGVVLNSTMKNSSQIQLLCPASISNISPQADGMTLHIDSDSSSNTVQASLVVLADGGKSPICGQLGIQRSVQQYEQYALIANVAFEKPHCNVAFERFTDTGPLAILPLNSIDQENRGSLVWTLTEQQSIEFKAMNQEELLEKLQERFGNRLGKFQQIGEKFIYPLSLSLAKEQVRPGLVLLGNVAHTLHPVAGQGLNLALRDMEVLVSILQQAFLQNKPLGQMSVLQQYLDQQETDQAQTANFTHYITQLFSSDSAGKAWFRKFGLFAVDLVPTIRRNFAERAMGLSGK
ncbi:MAG: 2-octaprenyl-6-methoxyphenyl hydroxylase [SAR86 cluster bacterium]|uniref:2-octaprenyl-6-methoxyphenyl hydroxylase n=1 Tax=SAR86 cluster bacterium TaxID=2030880 RepID=A0A2A5B2M4_9GAMM|nr:MAG: 2-octaprenyl-6-methoxyphenyl hydroxylase [SAR86 cluster bacterium]